MTPISWDAAVDIGVDAFGRPRGRLAPHAAASLRRVDAAIGRPLDVNEGWRSPQQADANYAAYQRYLNGGPWAPIALPGWASVHCAGEALDTDDHVHASIVAILNDHGWFHTVYRNGRLVEPWHFEYFEYRDNHRFAGIPTGQEKEKDMATPHEIWNHSLGARTAGNILKDIRRLLVDEVLASGTGRFFKHGDMPTGSNLWIYVLENGDFVRIRDLETARTYKDLNGQSARQVSGVALRELVAKLVLAGGRDLSAVPNTTRTVPTPEDEQDVPDEGA